jgi:fatty-acid peroxygenase
MLLQDYGSINRMDGDAHKHRKKMFMGLMSEQSVRKLCEIAKEEWIRRIEEESSGKEIILHEKSCEVLCQAALRWVGIEPSTKEARQWTAELSAMIDAAGSVGWSWARAMVLRERAERRARMFIRGVRQGWIPTADPSPLEVIALHRSVDDEFLPVRTAAVELINVLRPVVAVARYITFAALALHDHPDCRTQVAGDGPYLDHFVQEVRRYYPFFPMVGGRAKESFEWNGFRIQKGSLVLLDLYATNHDPQLWPEPERFEPSRFGDREPNRFDFVPQGGGDYYAGHRCPGESIAVSLIKMAVKRLAIAMDYVVPAQDFTIPLNRFPTLPRDGFILRII